MKTGPLGPTIFTSNYTALGRFNALFLATVGDVRERSLWMLLRVQDRVKEVEGFCRRAADQLAHIS